MARFELEWRRFEGRGAVPQFVHRLARAEGIDRLAVLAAKVVDEAWNGEFRVSCAGAEVYTDLRRIEVWRREAAAALPEVATGHVWRDDLRRDLAADVFVCGLTDAARPAVAAGALLRVDADALVRFARGALLRPRF